MDESPWGRFLRKADERELDAHAVYEQAMIRGLTHGLSNMALALYLWCVSHCDIDLVEDDRLGAPRRGGNWAWVSISPLDPKDAASSAAAAAWNRNLFLPGAETDAAAQELVDAGLIHPDYDRPPSVCFVLVPPLDA